MDTAQPIVVDLFPGSVEGADGHDDFENSTPFPKTRPPRRADLITEAKTSNRRSRGGHEGQGQQGRQQKKIQREILILLKGKPRNGYFNDRMFERLPGPHAVTFARSHLELFRSRQYWVCEKSDGVRTMLYMTKTGSYFVNRRFKLEKIKDSCYSEFFCSRGPTLLDGEMLDCQHDKSVHNKVFMAFDAVIVNGQNCANSPLSKRLRLFRDEAILPFWKRNRAILSKLPFVIKAKTFYQTDQIASVLQMITKTGERSYEFDDQNSDKLLRQINGNDGLVFTAEDDDFMQKKKKNSLLKWKFLELNTIDFKVKKPFFNRSGKLQLYYATKRNPEALFGTSELSNEEKKLFLQLLSGRPSGILECRPDFQAEEQKSQTAASSSPSVDRRDFRWVPLLYRSDRSTPNFEFTVKGVLKTIEQNITQKELIDAACKPRIEVVKHSGECQRWIKHRGFGFIFCDKLGKEVFVHTSELTNCDRLYPGDYVEFLMEKDRSGKLKAVEVEWFD